MFKDLQKAIFQEESRAETSFVQQSDQKTADFELSHQLTNSNWYDSLEIPKIDFPIFDGVEPHEWIRNCEQYFITHAISDDIKLRLAELHLRGEVELWLIRWKLSNPYMSMSWEFLKDEVCNTYDAPGQIIVGSIKEANDDADTIGEGITQHELEPFTIHESVDEEHVGEVCYCEETVKRSANGLSKAWVEEVKWGLKVILGQNAIDDAAHKVFDEMSQSFRAALTKRPAITNHGRRFRSFSAIAIDTVKVTRIDSSNLTAIWMHSSLTVLTTYVNNLTYQLLGQCKNAILFIDNDAWFLFDPGGWTISSYNGSYGFSYGELIDNICWKIKTDLANNDVSLVTPSPEVLLEGYYVIQRRCDSFEINGEQGDYGLTKSVRIDYKQFSVTNEDLYEAHMFGYTKKLMPKSKPCISLGMRWYILQIEDSQRRHGFLLDYETMITEFTRLSMSSEFLDGAEVAVEVVCTCTNIPHRKKSISVIATICHKTIENCKTIADGLDPKDMVSDVKNKYHDGGEIRELDNLEGYLLAGYIMASPFAPRVPHQAKVQLLLERGMMANVVTWSLSTLGAVIEDLTESLKVACEENEKASTRVSNKDDNGLKTRNEMICNVEKSVLDPKNLSTLWNLLLALLHDMGGINAAVLMIWVLGNLMRFLWDPGRDLYGICMCCKTEVVVVAGPNGEPVDTSTGSDYGGRNDLGGGYGISEVVLAVDEVFVYVRNEKQCCCIAENLIIIAYEDYTRKHREGYASVMTARAVDLWTVRYEGAPGPVPIFLECLKRKNYEVSFTVSAFDDTMNRYSIFVGAPVSKVMYATLLIFLLRQHGGYNAVKGWNLKWFGLQGWTDKLGGGFAIIITGDSITAMISRSNGMPHLRPKSINRTSCWERSITGPILTVIDVVGVFIGVVTNSYANDNKEEDVYDNIISIISPNVTLLINNEDLSEGMRILADAIVTTISMGDAKLGNYVWDPGLYMPWIFPSLRAMMF